MDDHNQGGYAVKKFWIRLINMLLAVLDWRLRTIYWLEDKRDDLVDRHPLSRYERT